MAATTKRGRPKGAKTIDAPVQDVAVSRCRRCGSTQRSKYRKDQEYARDFPERGLSPDGQPYDVIVWRRTQCMECGQWRRDKTYETRGTGSGR